MSKIKESKERKDEEQTAEIALPCAGTAGAGSPGEYG